MAEKSEGNEQDCVKTIEVKKATNNIMEYQQLPPVSMIIGSPNTVQAPHVHVMNANNNTNGNGNNHISSNQLLTMQPPLLPLQVAHNLHQLTSAHNGQSNNVHHGNNNQNQSSQSLPPTAQLLQAIHNNTQQQQQQQNNGQNMSSNTDGTTNNNNNNNSNATNDENNRWTQYQVQQLWRHHAYLNGKVTRVARERLRSSRQNKSARKKHHEKHIKKNFRKEISELHNDSKIYK